MIIRSEKDPLSILKRVIGAPRLSWKAKGVLCYLSGKEDDEHKATDIKDLLLHSPAKITAVTSAIKELEKFGHVRTKRGGVK